jgi:hypothetical protein
MRFQRGNRSTRAAHVDLGNFIEWSVILSLLPGFRRRFHAFRAVRDRRF